MSEVAIAFPNDEANAQVIVSRLQIDGIVARVDRGLHAGWLTPAQGQMRVLVDERDAKKAREIVDAGTPKRRR
jgi:hypothetical protein